MGGSPSVPEAKIPPERTFIVTGANTGIGYATAKKIAQLGGRVVIACRSEQKAKDAIERMKKETKEEVTKSGKTGVPELNIQFMRLDLSSFESTIGFAHKYKESGLSLHVLVCNAGVLGTSEKALTDDGYELMYQVNYLSHFLLTLLLLPLLKKSAPNSRIINVSSDAHRYSEFKLDNIQGQKSYSNMKFYGNSKLFQVMNMHSLSRAISGANIPVLSVHPGFVETEFFRSQSGGSGGLLKRLAPVVAKNSDSGSRTLLVAALDSKYDGMTALYFKDGKPSSSSSLTRNEEKQKLLWTYSLQCLRGRLDDDILQEIGEKLENIKSPDAAPAPDE